MGLTGSTFVRSDSDSFFVFDLQVSSFRFILKFVLRFVLLRFVNLQLQSSKSRYVYLNKFNLNKKTTCFRTSIYLLVAINFSA
ncbi:hypothetical protein P8452_14563 [Trifolium repens]|nr:hypothetical protein P8452_14563 [Trifolium repens]